MLLAAALLAALPLFLYLHGTQPPALVDASLRKLESGPVVGIDSDYDTHAWLGIRYAEASRWRAPEPVKPWQTRFDANRFGDFCSQYAGPAVTINALTWGEVAGSEDCLYLNLWAPRFASQDVARSNALPVMVWIHGGGNTAGRADSYQMARLASSEQVIVVSINYRLGLFGWFSHRALRDTSANPVDGSGNYGILDMIESLRWVKRNIAAFGGDPNNVTVFGESAGARDTLGLLASPMASGLFHRAIVQSGLTDSATIAQAENYTDDVESGFNSSSGELLIKLLLADQRAINREQAKEALAAMSSQEIADYLRSKTPQQLIPHYPDRAMGMYALPQLIQDGTVLPQTDLVNVFADADDFNAVPLMIGSNRDEMKLFLISDPTLVETRWGLVREVIDAERFEQQNRYLSDYWKADAVDQLADIISQAHPGNVWAYRFDWDEGGSNFMADYAQLLGAAHSLELSFVFGQWSGLMLPGVFTDSNRHSYEPLSAAMMAYWGAFAHAGNPGDADGRTTQIWQSWGEGSSPQGQFIVFDSETDGGIRMSNDTLTIAGLKQRLASDPDIVEQRDRCKLYFDMFYQRRTWSQDEYRQLNGEGCERYTFDSSR